ncbi:hypothetical protein E4V51_15730 [Paenibacillus sp. 28ISP30-2]|nr:hypothetical protein [Paenibacillus sp. 28ISP30-2]
MWENERLYLGSSKLGSSFRSLLSRSDEPTSEPQSRFGIPYAAFCLKKKQTTTLTDASVPC